MSNNFYIKLTVLLISFVFTINSNLFAQDDLSNEEQVEEYKKRKPKIAERDGIKASLDALRNNGALQRASRTRVNQVSLRASLRSRQTVSAADNTVTEEVIAIKHVLTCETQMNCQTANDWGNNNNFSASGVLISHGHGGEIMYHLFLRQELTPDEDSISNESTKVHEGILALDGISYATWMIDFDPTGQQDVGASE